ncbi:hypothetical protein T439DRAFT_330297 [Meredithblackwellia eburnea MCA 4105]
MFNLALPRPSVPTLATFGVILTYAIEWGGNILIPAAYRQYYLCPTCHRDKWKFCWTGFGAFTCLDCGRKWVCRIRRPSLRRTSKLRCLR